MTRYLPVAFGLLLIVLATIIQGHWTMRWSNRASEDLARMVTVLEQVPREFGDWKGEDKDIQEKQLRAAGSHGYVSRTYRNSKTGSLIDIYMICGYSRDIGVHEPKTCYVGSGFDMEDDQPHKHEFKVGGSSHSFWTSTFLKERGTQKIHQRVFWGWKTDGNWESPENARWKYGGYVPLAKMYITAPLGNEIDEPEESQANDFAAEFLPIVEELFSDEFKAIVAESTGQSSVD